MRTHFASVSSGLFWNHASSLWSPRTRNGIVSPPGANAVGGQRGARPAREHTRAAQQDYHSFAHARASAEVTEQVPKNTNISLTRAHEAQAQRRQAGSKAVQVRGQPRHPRSSPVGQGASPTTAAHGAGGRELHAGATTRDELGDDAKHGRRTSAVLNLPPGWPPHLCGPQQAW